VGLELEGHSLCEEGFLVATASRSAVTCETARPWQAWQVPVVRCWHGCLNTPGPTIFMPMGVMDPAARTALQAQGRCLLVAAARGPHRHQWCRHHDALEHCLVEEMTHSVTTYLGCQVVISDQGVPWVSRQALAVEVWPAVLLWPAVGAP